ncbi:hypothetical protein NLJ89_g11610 [Agrocybe chaxingu]|uniref:Uncharacterized protein n=1 Tax=Agrocybe chaxingu TaxID=84603 RepID=A0A9W8JPM8_9AGAR|nr:hypothetical protein NLJ89_g11610 [Agrocybe chaxingu]
MKFTFGFVTLALALSASALPVRVTRRAQDLQNGPEAIAQLEKLKSITADVCGERHCSDKLNVAPVEPRQNRGWPRTRTRTRTRRAKERQQQRRQQQRR